MEEGPVKSAFFGSLVMFSLSLGCCAFAEDEVSSGREGNPPAPAAQLTDEVQATEAPIVNEEHSGAGSQTLFPRKNAEQASTAKEDTQKPPAQKRQKGHYAGARRPPVTPPQERKTSGKVKNPWFSSRTQPKTGKKEVVKDAPAESPEDRPFYTKKNPERSSLLFAQGNRADASTGQSQNAVEVNPYPRTGFQAPEGHIYLTGEWLYWRTRQEGMEFATSRQLHFDYQSGFRLGAGGHLPSFDGWCIYVNYTRFTPDASRGAHGSFYPLFMYVGAGVRGSAVTEAHAHWSIEFQTADIEFCRPYYLSKTLVFSPFFGLRGAWIKQHAHFHYKGGFIRHGNTFKTRFKNDFKGAGPLLGTELNWQLGQGFSLFGDIAAALIVGQFDNAQHQYQLHQREVVHLDTDFNLVSPTLQMVAGVAWDWNYNRDRGHLGFSAGFESQYWWKQNQTEQFTDDSLPTYVRQRGDLAFYGLTFRGRLDF